MSKCYKVNKELSGKFGLNFISEPFQVFDPAMQQKFARVSAAVKGYLTRRLLKTQKVREILKTINVNNVFTLNIQKIFLLYSVDPDLSFPLTSFGRSY